MKKTKTQLIEEFLSQPIKSGDCIQIKGYGSQNQDFWGLTTVLYVDDLYVFVAPYYSKGKKLSLLECHSYLITDIKRDISHIGVNPFQPEIFVRTFAIDLYGLFHNFGYKINLDNWEIVSKFTDKYLNGEVEEINFNPFVYKEGKREYYQRDLVWTVEQKQSLIDSIYNNVELGKFIVRTHKFEWLEKEVKNGNGKGLAFKDAVDGKQRFHALLEFVENKIPDSYGNYFQDLSKGAKRKFFNYRNFSYGELDENATDQDVLNTFLAINHTGVPQSLEHIEFVKSLRS